MACNKKALKDFFDDGKFSNELGVEISRFLVIANIFNFSGPKTAE